MGRFESCQLGVLSHASWAFWVMPVGRFESCQLGVLSHASWAFWVMPVGRFESCQFSSSVWAELTSGVTSCFVQRLFCLFVGCLMSQQHASASQGWIYSENFMWVATGKPIFKSLVWLNREKSHHKRDSNSGSSAFGADALTTWPTRWSLWRDKIEGLHALEWSPTHAWNDLANQRVISWRVNAWTADLKTAHCSL